MERDKIEAIVSKLQQSLELEVPIDFNKFDNILSDLTIKYNCKDLDVDGRISKDENGNYKFEGRFNQGVVSLNLPQIGILNTGNEEGFFEMLDKRLEIVKKALLFRNSLLQNVKSDNSPIHWQYGAIARLDKNEPIDKYLEDGFSTLSLGYISFCRIYWII